MTQQQILTRNQQYLLRQEGDLRRDEAILESEEKNLLDVWDNWFPTRNRSRDDEYRRELSLLQQTYTTLYPSITRENLLYIFLGNGKPVRQDPQEMYRREVQNLQRKFQQQEESDKRSLLQKGFQLAQRRAQLAGLRTWLEAELAREGLSTSSV